MSIARSIASYRCSHPLHCELDECVTFSTDTVVSTKISSKGSRPAHRSNAAFWSLQQSLTSSTYAKDRHEVADLEKRITELQVNLKDTKLRLKEAKKRFLASSRLHEIDMESMRALKPRLCFWEPRGRLPEDLSIKIFHEAGMEMRSHAAQVCNVFNNVIRSGRVRGAFDVKGGSIAAGGLWLC